MRAAQHRRRQRLHEGGRWLLFAGVLASTAAAAVGVLPDLATLPVAAIAAATVAKGLTS